MQRISFAPVLSATRSRDSCWITSNSQILCGDSRAGTVNRLSDHPRADAPTAWRRRCVRSTGDRDAARTRASRPGYSYPRRPRRAAPCWAYFAFSMTSTSRHRLVADVGRVSMICTRSPMPATPCSSCAFSLLVRRMTLPYRPCFTRSSTSTTMVFSILSLTTRPSRTLRYPRPARPGPVDSWSRSCHTLVRGDGQAQLALALDRVDPGDVAADGLQSPVVVQLAGGHLEAQVEQFFLVLTQPRGELVHGQLAQLRSGQTGGHHTSPSRVMKRHFIGSLWIARRMASRATGSATPDSSNMIRPGFPFAIHHSGEPLPEPMRVSAGFLVSGRSG